MPLARVSFCILCEAVRPEPRGKANILGFYGVLPHANMIVGEIGKPIPELMFLVGLRGPSDPFSLGARIISPDKSILASIEKEQAPKLSALEPERGAMGGLGFALLSFPLEGLYTIQILINDKESHSTTFTVRQGSLPPG